MGGNAIPFSERFSNEEYASVQAETVSFIEGMWLKQGDHFKIVKAYRNKEDFGDLDIVIAKSCITIEDFLFLAEKHSRVSKIVRNTDVVSIAYQVNFIDSSKIVQLDFIFVDNINVAANYFDFNDLGNLLGRIAHKMGFKFGHDGLKYVFRDGDNVYAEKIISTDWTEILPFMGYSFEEWNKGFNDLEDIFKFVASGKYFNPEIYLLHNRNYKARTRDSKRKTYNEFLRWCEETKSKDFYYPWPDDVELKEMVKTLALQQSFRVFPRWGEIYVEEVTAHLEQLKMKLWWNGDIARTVTGLEGKELGMFMKRFKEVFDLEECFKQGLASEALAQILFSSYS